MEVFNINFCGFITIFWSKLTTCSRRLRHCYIMLAQDRVKPQTIIQQNVAIGTVAVDGWAVVFGRNKTMFFTKTHIELHDTWGVGVRVGLCLKWHYDDEM